MSPYAPVEWTSSDETVATVDEDGLVTGVKVGDCVITATQIINGVCNFNNITASSIHCKIKYFHAFWKIGVS